MMQPTNSIQFIITALLCASQVASLPLATTNGTVHTAGTTTQLPARGINGKIYYGYSGADDMGSAGYAARLGRKPAIKNEFMRIDGNGFSDSKWADMYVNGVAASFPKALVMMTLEPFVGLSQLTSNTYNNIAAACVGWNKKGIRVLLRFAHEMNGNWYPWGSKASEYKATFRALALAIKQARSNAGLTSTPTLMLWSPNVAWDGQTNMYMDFYPGDDVVDWVGLSLYYFKDGVPTPGYFHKAITSGNGQSFYDMFCVQRKKPMIISETSAPVPIGTPVDQELARKQAWWRQLYSTDTAAKFPMLRAINWFEYTKLGKYYGVFTQQSIGDAFLADLPSSVMVYSG